MIVLVVFILAPAAAVFAWVAHDMRRQERLRLHGSEPAGKPAIVMVDGADVAEVPALAA